jgi:hypothetical protein
MFNTDPNRTDDELLADIKQGAVDTAGSRRANLVGNVLAPFAALLVKLSRDAAAETKRIKHLTWALIFLTVVLCVLALPSAYDFYEQKMLASLRACVKKSIDYPFQPMARHRKRKLRPIVVRTPDRSPSLEDELREIVRTTPPAPQMLMPV